MRAHKLSRLLAAPIALALAALACSPGGAPPTETPEPSPTRPRPTVTPAATPTPENAGAIRDVRDVQQATIQIVAQGTFVDPEVGVQANAAGAGSGFIISPDGLAVTNNHVVTGAARISVYLNGEEYRARILGVSECSDLAVIQVEGSDFRYLELYEGDVEVGLEVYAAGFPLGDPEFTLTKGIVSKARAGGESSWASVDSVIEHDATINPGNSGGPLVDEAGRLVGINYAGNSGTNQYFAIKAQDAQDIIDELADGNDVDSLGVNGQAIVWNDGQNSGIWVSSVKSGSPADNTGVQPGDILLTMEGLTLAADGTMTEYCDIIRSHKPGDPLSVEVLRFSTQEYLSGQMNGRELAVTYSFANELGNEVQASGTGEYTGYEVIRDDAGAIEIAVPVEWADRNGANWEVDGDIIGASISAAPDLGRFNGGWDEPGVFFGVTDDIARLGGYIQVLDIYKGSFSQNCEFVERRDYGENDPLFEGKFDIFTDCDGVGNVLIVLSARPKENQTAYLLLVVANIMTDADYSALDQIFNTFNVVGNLP